MSGRAKARREAKAADRNARRKQRAVAAADLKRCWHLTLRQQREMQSVYAKTAVELVEAATLRKLEVGTIDEFVIHKTHQPHCEMSWAEQVAGADDMAGVPNKRNGDAT